MVRVLPFRALRYDSAVMSDLARVTSPPHDVLTPQQKAEGRRDPYSIVHLILPEDGGAEGRFEVAAQRFRAWQEDGVLRPDPLPALYRYEVTHGPPADRRTMNAFFARVGLDATHREVRPHERTLERKTVDRLRLRQVTQCDLEPIWLLYRDPDAWVEGVLGGGLKVLDFTDREGTTHRVWRTTTPHVLAQVAAWFAPRNLVIADGHHRYRSALEHFAATGRPEDSAILACLARDGDPGIRVEATHRVVRWGRALPEALAACRVAWQVRPLPAPQPEGGSWVRAARELMQSLEGAGTAVLVGRSDTGLQAHGLWLQAPHTSRDLAVTLVQQKLLADCWGLEESASGQIAYERDTSECLRLVAEGAADLVVLLPPERIETVLDAAMEGRLMPAKATYFVPKPASGLVLGPLEEA